MCGDVSTTGGEPVFELLRSWGMLRRLDKPPENDLLWALVQSRKADIPCPTCLTPGVTLELDDRESGWDLSKPCSGCGATIPAERLSLYPNQSLCAACQGKVDQGGSPDADEFCPRCGSRMTLKKNSRGVTRYEMRCPACR